MDSIQLVFVIVYGEKAANPWSRFFLANLTDATSINLNIKTVKGQGAGTTYCKGNTFYLASPMKIYTGIHETSCNSTYTTTRNECHIHHASKVTRIVKNDERKSMNTQTL
jgi:hypothetical protein